MHSSQTSGQLREINICLAASMTNIPSKWFSCAKYILGTRFRRFRQVWRRTAPVTWRRRRLTFVVALRGAHPQPRRTLGDCSRTAHFATRHALTPLRSPCDRCDRPLAVYAIVRACRSHGLARFQLSHARSVWSKLPTASFSRVTMGFAEAALMICSSATVKLAIMHRVVPSAASHCLVKPTPTLQTAWRC